MRTSLKKESIMNAAEKLFNQQGFHAVGVKSILDQAGVAPMTMYYHFKSKEDLIIEILARREENYFQHLEESVNKKKNLNTYLKSLVKAHINWLNKESYNGCLFLRAKQEYEGINEEIVELTIQHKTKLLTQCNQDLQSFKTSDSLGMQLSIILEGLTSIIQVSGHDEVKKAAKEIIKSLKLNK
ncbi:TetR/AcrR family transcriptional regulator [Gracilibacillus oryzae]|uniref:TetR/AcrR family transcriptional regulator n=1 Tax=Gracilibacillus oryzae TaxID=1672701 RepID=A0A7C8GR61_9BACI|nr:TetR/AcrR family transcriptional regulator [Gracilibacillus oryzae]KAB8126631.1 TetR/AcrR family transcriptional regulator [Gracilibacillus oryzae]